MGTQRQLGMISKTGDQIRSLSGQADEGAGSVDHMARNLERVGAPQLANNLSTTSRAVENTSKAAKNADKDVGSMSDKVDTLGKRADRTGGMLDRLAQKLTALRPPLMAALVPMIGLAAQGLGGLLSGVTSLLPRLSDLSGLLGPAGIAFAGMGTAMITAKLAFGDLSKAMNGNKKALEELTPQGKQFLQTLKLYKPLLQEIRSSAQQGLFPGLSASLRELAGSQPMISQLVRGMGSQLGGIAQHASGLFTSRSFSTDFQAIVEGGTRAVGQMGTAVLNVANVVRNFLVAALPFADWIGRTVDNLTGMAARSSSAARETGRLGEYFQRTQKALESFGSILHNVFDIVKAVGHASRSMGEGLWESIDRTTGKWAAFLSGGQGQQDMLSYFTRMQPVLHEVGKFFGDLVKGVGELAGGNGAARAFRQLDEAIPSLVKGLSTLTETFGPVVIGGIKEVVTLLSLLAGDTGPIGGLLKGFVGVLTTLNKILKAVPVLGTLLSSALAVAAISSFTGRLSGMEGSIGKLARSWFGVKTAADEASAAESRAAGVGVSGGAPRGRYPVAPPVGYSRATAAEESGGLRNSLTGLSLTGAAGVAALRQRGGALLKSLPGMAGGALAAGAEIAVPILLFNGLLEGLGSQGGASERGAAALSGMTGGLSKMLGGPFNPTVVSGGEAQEHALAAFQRSGVTGGRARVALGHGQTVEIQQPQAGFNRATGAFTGQGVSTALARSEVQNRGVEARGAERTLAHPGNMSANEVAVERAHFMYLTELVHDYEGVVDRAIAKAKTHGTELAQGFGTAYSIYERSYGPSKAWAMTSKGILSDMAHLGNQGKMALGQGVLTWAKELEAREPALRKPIEAWIRSVEHGMDGMHQKVRIVNGEIFTNSFTAWQEIGKAIEGPAAKAEYFVKGTFSRIFQAAVAQLETFGYSKAAATTLIKGVEHGEIKSSQIGTGAFSQGLVNTNAQQNNKANHRGKAGGGRVGGVGLQDGVAIVAPGELVINRHQERLVDGMLSRFGTSLGGLVTSHPWPHHAGYAGGGFIADPGTNFSMGNEPTIARDLSAMGRAEGWTIHGISGYRSPGHSVAVGGFANDPHTRGEAADIGINSSSLSSASVLTAGLLARFGLYRPFYPASAHEINHVQLLGSGAIHGGAVGLGGLSPMNPGGGGAPASIHLQRMSGRGGIPSALEAAAWNSVAGGAQARINNALASVGTLGGGAPGGATGGHAAGSGQMRAWAKAGLRAAGLPGTPSEISTIVYTMTRESGGNPRSINTWDSNAKAGHPSQGLMELIPENFAQYHVPGTSSNIMDPVANVAASVRYMIARYGHIVGMSPYASGGRIPGFGGWNARGGSGTFNKPTLIGVGDGHGAEDVTITPRTVRAGRGARSSTGGVNITFAPGSIVVHGASEHAANELVGKVMDRLAAELENMNLEHETEVSS